MIHLMTSLHQQLVNFYLLIITIQFMGISQSLSMSADHFFFSSSEQNPKSKLQRETGKQRGRKRRGSDSKPRYCPPARQHVVTELANTLNQIWTQIKEEKKCSFPAKQRFLLLHPGDNTVYPYSSGTHLTPQTPCGSKTWCHFSN